MNNIGAWVEAFRLRTLPLALSCVFMATFLAYYYGEFRSSVFFFAVATTLFLQILSNLANDYGDAVKGTDNEFRLGPKRAVQSGLISASQMKLGVIVFAILSFLSGIGLLVVAFGSVDIYFISFLLLGLAAIAAAVKYTVGKNAYGYSGLGDVFVLIFFGWVGVLGTFYLYAGSMSWELFLPACAVGLFSVGVLNLNNLRDIENDRASGKNTLIVKLGVRFGAVYHLLLIFFGWISVLLFTLLNWHGIAQLLYLLTLPLFFINARKALTFKDPRELIPSLKQLALGTFFFTILFGLGLVLVDLM